MLATNFSLCCFCSVAYHLRIASLSKLNRHWIHNFVVFAHRVKLGKDLFTSEHLHHDLRSWHLELHVFLPVEGVVDEGLSEDEAPHLLTHVHDARRALVHDQARDEHPLPKDVVPDHFRPNDSCHNFARVHPHLQVQVC